MNSLTTKLFILFMFFYIPSSLGVVIVSKPGGYVQIRTSEVVELNRTVEGHKRKLVLTALGENRSGPIFLQLEYPDTPFWQGFLFKCVKKLAEISEKKMATIGPVTYLGHTLTSSHGSGAAINRWRAWYGNSDNSMIVQSNISCNLENKRF